MRSPLTRPLAAALLVAGSLAAQVSWADLLVNGNFEQGPSIPSLNPIMAVAPGNDALSGWTVSGGAIDIVTDNYWVPLSGHRSIVLSSSGPGAIEQAISTAPGAIYRLTFWLSGEPFSSPTIKHLRLTAGASTQDQTYDITDAWHWDMAWSQRTFDFAATGSTTTLSLASTDATQWGPALDSMKVEQVSAGVPGSATALAQSNPTAPPSTPEAVPSGTTNAAAATSAAPAATAEAPGGTSIAAPARMRTPSHRALRSTVPMAGHYRIWRRSPPTSQNIDACPAENTRARS